MKAERAHRIFVTWMLAVDVVMLAAAFGAAFG
jgi:hypothetical protein